MYAGFTREETYITGEEEEQLYKRFLSGDRSARNQLIRAHIWLVVLLAKRFERAVQDDLIQTALLALVKLLDAKPDISKRKRLAPLANRVCQRAFCDFFRHQQKPLRISSRKNTAARIVESTFPEPLKASLQQIAAVTGGSLKQARNTQKALQANQVVESMDEHLAREVPLEHADPAQVDPTRGVYFEHLMSVLGEQLTEQELEVVFLIVVAGMKRPEVRKLLGVSHNVVKVAISKLHGCRLAEGSFFNPGGPRHIPSHVARAGFSLEDLEQCDDMSHLHSMDKYSRAMKNDHEGE